MLTPFKEAEKGNINLTFVDFVVEDVIDAGDLQVSTDVDNVIDEAGFTDLTFMLFVSRPIIAALNRD